MAIWYDKDTPDFAEFATIFWDDEIVEELTADGSWGDGKALDVVDAFRAGTADPRASYDIKLALGRLAYKADML